MKIRVYYEDTDAGGIVYYANYLKFIERARSELFFSQGLIPHDDEGFFVVKRVEADYISSARLGDEIEVKTSIKELKNVSCTLQQTIVLGNNKLFEAHVTLAFLKEGKLSRIPLRYKEVFVKAFQAL